MQAKWRAVEEHLLSEAPPSAPFRTALLRLRLSDETQVGRRWRVTWSASLSSARSDNGMRSSLTMPIMCSVWYSFAVQVAAALEQVAAAAGEEVTLGSYLVRCGRF